MDWKGLAALWGAGLSTWLAVTRLLPDRPRFQLGPPEEGSSGRAVIGGADVRFSTAVIRVVNPAKRMVCVRDWKRVRWRGGVPEIGLHTARSKIITEVGHPGALQLLLPSEGQTEVEVTYEQRCVWLLLFLWQGPWLLPVWLPTLLVVSSKRIARYGEAAKRTLLLNP